MPGSDQHTSGPQKLGSPLEECGQKVLRSLSKHLTLKRVKERGVRLNERRHSSKFHGYNVKSPSTIAKSMLACF